jgi:hypothetical protein
MILLPPNSSRELGAGPPSSPPALLPVGADEGQHVLDRHRSRDLLDLDPGTGEAGDGRVRDDQ